VKKLLNCATVLDGNQTVDPLTLLRVHRPTPAQELGASDWWILGWPCVKSSKKIGIGVLLDPTEVVSTGTAIRNDNVTVNATLKIFNSKFD
jgi:hypothetical protein